MRSYSKISNQQGFSMLEVMVALIVMVIVAGAVFALMRDSMKFATATYEMTDATENLRIAQEFVNRDVLNAGDGLKSISTILVPTAFVTNYLTLNPVAGSPLGILTTDNNVPANTAVRGANPAATVRTGTDRQTILEIDPSFVPVALAASAIDSNGSSITVSTADLPRFTAGEVYFLTSGDGGTFATITTIDAVNKKLNFANGDTYGLNLTGAGGYINTISAGGTAATSLQRMKIIHYYVNSNGLLMRRVFGVPGAGFRENPVAEHVVNVQFNYSLVTVDASGNVVGSTTSTLATSSDQLAVRQVEVKITVETPHTLQNNAKQQLVGTTSTSVRNMQFRQALQP